MRSILNRNNTQRLGFGLITLMTVMTILPIIGVVVYILLQGGSAIS